MNHFELLQHFIIGLAVGMVVPIMVFAAGVAFSNLLDKLTGCKKSV